MAIRITLECGHSAMLRMRTTPQGYTHDWELFVRGVDNADIHHYVEKGKYIYESSSFSLLRVGCNRNSGISRMVQYLIENKSICLI